MRGLGAEWRNAACADARESAQPRASGCGEVYLRLPRFSSCISLLFSHHAERSGAYLHHGQGTFIPTPAPILAFVDGTVDSPTVSSAASLATSSLGLRLVASSWLPSSSSTRTRSTLRSVSGTHLRVSLGRSDAIARCRRLRRPQRQGLLPGPHQVHGVWPSRRHGLAGSRRGQDWSLDARCHQPACFCSG
jgi:hypothetical protein